MIRRRYPLPIVILILLGIVAVGAVFEHVRDKRMLRRYRGELIAQGEKLEVEKLMPAFSGEANLAANHLVQAASQLNKNGLVLPANPPGAMRFFSSGKAIVGWKQPDIRDGKVHTNSWEELAAQLSDEREALTEIRVSLEQDRLNWNLNYKQGYSLLLPHLTDTKKIAQWLSAATVNDLHQGDLEGAQRDLQSLLSLANAYRDERVVISQLVRIAITAITLSATWEALQADHWSDGGLADLQKRWEDLDFMEPMGKSIEMERAMTVEIIDRMRRSRDERKQFFDSLPTAGPTPMTAPGGVQDTGDYVLSVAKRAMETVEMTGRDTLWCWFWSYEDERRCLSGDQSAISRFRSAAANRVFGSLPSGGDDSRFSRMDWQELSDAKYCISAMREGTWDSSILKVRRIETMRAMVGTAIALKRYRLHNDKLPPNLAALVPEYFREAPRDFMDGKELRYRLNPDGSFLLYSVGEDGKDDGGDAGGEAGPLTSESSMSIFSVKSRDMVWPTPATVDEVAEAREKEDKKKRPATNSSPMSQQMLERYGLTPKK